MKTGRYTSAMILTYVLLGFSIAHAQENLAQEAYLIFKQHCFNCHGEHGAFTEDLVIEYTALIDNGTVIPGDPDGSEFYRRLIEDTPDKPRMPWRSPPLSEEARDTIRHWIEIGAPNWEVQYDINFITTEILLTESFS